MKYLDQHFTPPEIARNMLNYASIKAPNYIADFAAGEGALLDAARLRWPKARLIATDIDPKIVNGIKAVKSYIEISKCDFLNLNSSNKCSVLKGVKGSISLIILNPPFSCKGSIYHNSNYNNQILKSGVALAFVINSLQYLAESGELISILPESSIYGDRDAASLRHIGKDYRIRILERYGASTFAGCSANTVLVKFSKNMCLKDHALRIEASTLRVRDNNIILQRGKLDMTPLNKRKFKKYKLYPLVHTTELNNNKIQYNGYFVDKTEYLINGPAILIPRVGRPNKGKIALLKKNEQVALTNCLIALKARTNGQIQVIYSKLIRKWNDFEKLYTGTGARYITTSKITAFLNQEER